MTELADTEGVSAEQDGTVGQAGENDSNAPTSQPVAGETEKPAPKVEIKNRLSGVSLGAAEAVYQSLSKTVSHFEKGIRRQRRIRLLAERRYKKRKRK